MATLETKLHIESWNEEPYRELADGQKWTRTEVTLTGTEGLTAGSFESLMYYRPDGTGTYVLTMHLTGTLDGQSGSLALQGGGTYEEQTARITATVVPGSGTGELAGITGSAESVSTGADYPNMPLTLHYELA